MTTLSLVQSWARPTFFRRQLDTVHRFSFYTEAHELVMVYHYDAMLNDCPDVLVFIPQEGSENDKILAGSDSRVAEELFSQLEACSSLSVLEVSLLVSSLIEVLQVIFEFWGDYNLRAWETLSYKDALAFWERAESIAQKRLNLNGEILTVRV